VSSQLSHIAVLSEENLTALQDCLTLILVMTSKDASPVYNLSRVLWDCKPQLSDDRFALYTSALKEITAQLYNLRGRHWLTT
jgi:hypothetical protein